MATMNAHTKFSYNIGNIPPAKCEALNDEINFKNVF